MGTQKEPNYSVEQEAKITAFAENLGRPLNLADATALGASLGKSARSVIAKIGRMGIAYARKQPTTKSGEPVRSKSKIVGEIADLLDVAHDSLDGMEKAPKAALQTVAREVERLTATG